MAKSRKESDNESGFLSRWFGGSKSKASPSMPKAERSSTAKNDTKEIVGSISEKKSPQMEMSDSKWSLKENAGTTSKKKTPKPSQPYIGKPDLTPDSPAEMVDQGLRIIVPVDIQAFVVEKAGVVEDEDTAKGAKKLSQPHNWLNPGVNGSPLSRGIHLHWAMPDGLMVGEEIDDSTITIDDNTELHEMQTFPALPNRWIVVRQWPDQSSPLDTQSEYTSHMHWKSKAWIINANDQTTTELSQWNSPGVQESLMTAIDDGDPATAEDAVTWTAVYAESQGRFTFHDIPESDVDGPLNYMVAGWYSKASQDPLFCSKKTSRGEWKETLEELGWSVIEQEILDQIGNSGVSDGWGYFDGN